MFSEKFSYSLNGKFFKVLFILFPPYKGGLFFNSKELHK